MGAIGKAISKVFGGSSSSPTVETVTTDPAVTTVATSDVSADTSSATANKKRKGFASTQTSTLATSSNEGRSTLG